MSRSFDIKLDKISEFYQTFNISAVHFKMIADKCFLICSEGHALHEKITVIQWQLSFTRCQLQLALSILGQTAQESPIRECFPHLSITLADRIGHCVAVSEYMCSKQL